MISVLGYDEDTYYLSFDDVMNFLEAIGEQPPSPEEAYNLFLSFADSDEEVN
jgi:hypothetical protein